MLAVFLDQQVDCVLRDGYLPRRGFRLWSGEHHLPTGVVSVLFTDGDGFVVNVQVRPEEGHQFTLPQSADQLQIEHGQDISGVDGVQVGLEVLRQECLHLYLLYLGSDAVISGIPGNQPFFHRSLESAVQSEVNTPYCGTAQTGVAFAAAPLNSAFLHQILVELLEVTGGQLLQLDLSDLGNGVGLDDQVVAVCRRWPDVGLGVELVPAAEPGGYRVILVAAHIQTDCLLLCLGQLLFDLCLGLTQHILDDSLASLRIIAGGVPAFPATVLPLADVALAVGSLFCHRLSPPCSHTPYHNLGKESY